MKQLKLNNIYESQHITQPTKSTSLKLIDIITILYSGFCVLELSTSSFKFICLFLLILWFITAIFTNSKSVNNIINNKAVVILFLYAFFYFLYVSLVDGLVMGLKHSFTIIISESPFFLLLYYDDEDNRNSMTNLLPFAFFAVVLVLCRNILQLIANDPNAARIMAANINIYNSYITGGGYQIAYLLALSIPVLITTLKLRKHKLLTVALTLVFIYTLLKCSYTTAILTCVVELFLLLIFTTNSDKEKSIRLILFFLLLFVLLLSKSAIGNFFINTVSPFFDGTFVERRMRELGEFILGNASDNNGAVSRIELYEISIKTFFKNPIFGISYLTKFDSALEITYGGVRNIGMHSDIFDGFARVGIFYVLYIIYYYNAVKHIKNHGSNLYIIIAIAFFALKTINISSAFGLSYVVYFAIPILLSGREGINHSNHRDEVLNE